MAHYAVRKYPGWPQHMLTTMLAHFFSVAPATSSGKKSTRADGLATPGLTGSRITPAHVYDCRRPRPGHLGATPQS